MRQFGVGLEFAGVPRDETTVEVRQGQPVFVRRLPELVSQDHAVGELRIQHPGQPFAFVN
ncbi:MAG TPA: hypothetical protein VFC19_12515 [Candidatus Limnocylindrales bacterium]|nr:hypothetical protein [Candidatus Limnocylindrales bacterium]